MHENGRSWALIPSTGAGQHTWMLFNLQKCFLGKKVTLRAAQPCTIHRVFRVPTLQRDARLQNADAAEVSPTPAIKAASANSRNTASSASWLVSGVTLSSWGWYSWAASQQRCGWLLPSCRAHGLAIAAAQRNLRPDFVRKLAWPALGRCSDIYPFRVVLLVGVGPALLRGPVESRQFRDRNCM